MRINKNSPSKLTSTHFVRPYQPFKVTWTFLCNIKPTHVLTLWNKMFDIIELFMKQNTHVQEGGKEEFITNFNLIILT